jgi:hypothetical protein
VSFTVPVGHLFVQFLKVLLEKSTMYPPAQDRQLVDDEEHPKQLDEQVEHLFKLLSAKVPKGHKVETTHDFDTELRKVPLGHEVHDIASDWQVAHEDEHERHMLAGSG